jgi:hypothetical protein
MSTTRRQFLDSLAVGATAVATMPAALAAMPAEFRAVSGGAEQEAWDTRWHERLNTRLRTVFDVPEVESGFPVWRASIWAAQYQQVLNVAPRETSTALVLRHNAIILAMQQSFWAKYGIGKAHKVTNPLTEAPTDRNPAMLDATDGVPEPYVNFALDKFIARGGIALACNLALQHVVVPMVAKTENLNEAQANERARQYLVPGVILQPSGMFAAIRAQEAGAMYFRAS